MSAEDARSSDTKEWPSESAMRAARILLPQLANDNLRAEWVWNTAKIIDRETRCAELERTIALITEEFNAKPVGAQEYARMAGDNAALKMKCAELERQLADAIWHRDNSEKGEQIAINALHESQAQVKELADALRRIAKLDYTHAATNCAAFEAVGIADAALGKLGKGEEQP